MRLFKDTLGREWTISITVYTVGRVKAALKIHLPSLFNDNGKPLADLLGDEEKLAAVIWELGKEENEKAGLSQEGLARIFAGETADALTDLFLEELTDFFRDPKRRAALRKALATFKEVGKRILEQATAGMEMTPEMMDRMAAGVIENFRSETSLNGTYGTVPESLGSTPAA